MEVGNVNMAQMDRILSLGEDHHRQIDELEVEMLNYPPVDCPLKHVLTPGLYTRTIFMPAGTLITSMHHLTEHPYFILSGSCMVRINNEEWKYLEGPHQGITKADTRRVLYIVEDCIWVTVHARMDDETVEDVERRILGKRENKLLGARIKNNSLIKELDHAY